MKLILIQDMYIPKGFNVIIKTRSKNFTYRNAFIVSNSPMDYWWTKKKQLLLVKKIILGGGIIIGDNDECLKFLILKFLI